MSKKSDNSNSVDYGKRMIRTVVFGMEGRKYEAIQHIIRFKNSEMILAETVAEL